MATHLTGDTASEPVDIVGDYGAGAYGPTIIFKLLSADAARWLFRVFEQVATDDREVVLTDRISIGGIDRLALRRRADATPGLRQTRPGEFDWTDSTDGWSDRAGLIEPFVEGRSGHQYLTTEGVDDALVEVSFGEPDVNVS